MTRDNAKKRYARQPIVMSATVISNQVEPVRGGDHEAAYWLGYIFPFVLGGVFLVAMVWNFWIKKLLEKKIELPPETDERPRKRRGSSHDAADDDGGA